MNETHGITKENLLSSLPAVLAADESMEALAAAIAEVLAGRVEEIGSLSIYAQIDKLPEELLDILAHDFKVDWYDSSFDIDTKRDLLLDSWRVHRILGTKRAVEIAVQDAFGGGEVQEWFEYNGEPYHFRVGGVDPNRITEGFGAFLEFLAKVKRQSAVLDHITAETGANEKLYVGFAMRTGRNETVPCAAYPELEMLTPYADETGAVLCDELLGALIEE